MVASSVIGALRVNLGLDSAQFSNGARRAQDSMGRMERTMRGAGRRIANIGRAIGYSFAAIGTAAVVGAVSGSRQLQDLANQARLAGESAQDFKVLALAAQEFGISQEQLSDILKDVNDKFGDFAATGQGPLKDFFENIAPQVGVTQEAFEGLSSSEALQLYISSLEQANLSQSQMTFYMEAIANDATALIPLFQNNGAAIRDMTERANELGLSLDDNVIQAASRAKSEFSVVADVLKTRMAAAFVELLPALTEFAEVAIPVVVNAINSLKPIIESIAALLRGDFKAAWEAIKPTISSLADTIIDILNGLIDRAAQAIIDLGAAILREIQAIPGRVIEAAREVGRNIVQGVVDGISGANVQLSEASAAMARGGINAARETLEIRSPSRVFRQIGQFMSEGMALGIQDSADQVASASSDLSQSATEVANGGLRGLFADSFSNITEGWSAVVDHFKRGLQSMASNLINSGIDTLMQSIFGGGGGLGFIAGAFGGSSGTGALGLPSFNGGGFTGAGARTGGLDGRGGFPAMLHPNETVIDHTKGGGGAGGSITLNVNSDPAVIVQIAENTTGAAIKQNNRAMNDGFNQRTNAYTTDPRRRGAQ